MASVKSKQNSISFEEAFTRLEKIADQLESGELSLDASIKAFEEGMELIRICTNQLDDAEEKLKKLVKTDDGFQLELMRSEE